MRAHLQASVESDLSAAPLQLRLLCVCVCGGGSNTSDANSSISATETLLGSSPCNHGNRGILLVGSSQ